MRKAVYILSVMALWWPATAAAEDLGPTPAELQHSRAVATAYWHSSLEPTVVMADLPLTVGARAQTLTNTIELNAAIDWRDFHEITCFMFVHEEGHLVLGLSYFAAINPTDPAHSPDPTNIMYGGGEVGDGPPPTPEQVLQASKSIGCYEPPPAPAKAKPAQHHRHHRFSSYGKRSSKRRK